MKHYLRLGALLMSCLVLIGQGCVSFGGDKNTAAGPAGVYVSTKNGEEWTQIVSFPTTEGNKQLPQGEVYRFFEDPQDPKALYWASRENGLIYSYDEGRSWEIAAAPLNTGFVYSVAIHPAESCTIYATNGRQIFKTLDCARSWTEVFREGQAKFIVTSVALNPFAPFQVYASTSGGSVYRSLDGGATWEVVVRLKSVDIREIMFDRNAEGHLFLASKDDGLYRTKDGGSSWENLAPKFKEYAGALQFRRFLVYPGKGEQIYWISKYGILTSRNSGEDWEPIPLVTPPGSVDIYGFAVNPRNDKELFYTGSIGDKSTFYRSVDGGATWETRKLPTRQIPTAIRVHPTNDAWVYLGFTMIPKS